MANHITFTQCAIAADEALREAITLEGDRNDKFSRRGITREQIVTKLQRVEQLLKFALIVLEP